IETANDFPGDEEPAPPPAVPVPPVRVETAKPVEAKKPEPPPKPKPVEAKKPIPKVEPPKRKPVPKPIEPPKPSEPAPPADEFPDDFPGDDEPAAEASAAPATEAWQPEAWDALPVRDSVAPTATRGAGGSPAHPEQGQDRAGETTPPTPEKAVRSPRRWAPLVIGAMLAILGIVALIGWRSISQSIASNEKERFDAAKALYDKREFADASAALQKMHRDFPDSIDSKKYRFLAELSDVREAVYRYHESPDELSKSLQRVLQFATVYKDDPLLRKRESDVWETLDDLARQLTKAAESDKSSPQLAQARRAWSEAKRFQPPPNKSKSERERTFEEDWARIDKMLAEHHERERVIATIKKHIEKATAAGVQESLLLAEKTKRTSESEIRGLLNDLFKAQREQVVFEPASLDSKQNVAAEDDLPSLSITPTVAFTRPVAVSGPLVLALARGVLYALEPTKGELRWARRVGIDTHVLPLRVPADAITPELLLVLSSDQRSLSAVIADTGETFWQTPLSGACLGTPVLVDRQVLVATVGGRIDEIEIAEGRRLGSYEVGQPLPLGGIRQPGTPLVYFPGDEFCLYAFDITKRSCTNILYTRHRAGTLPGLPTFVRAGKQSLLLWSERRGPGQAEIKPYALPLTEPEQAPIKPRIAIDGLSASPSLLGDRLSVLSETGMLSLWSYHQKGTRDPLLFPLLKHDFALEASKRPGRCEVVHGDADNLWALTHGHLHRIELAFDSKRGPDLVARWTQPVKLGNLLHAAQAAREPDGTHVLFLTTQAEDHPTCLCSAIDANAGKILWQRQLGAIPQDAPQIVDTHVVLPESLGLLRIAIGKSDKRWTSAGDWLLQESWRGANHTLLTTPNSIVRLSWATGDKKLRVQIGSDKLRALDVELPAPPHGTPAIIDQHLLLPLYNGIIARIDLQTGSLVNGPDWRAVGAEDQSLGHILPLTTSDFIATDGSRGLQRISTDGKAWDKRASAQLAFRITAAPVLVSDGGKPGICVADASDTLTLLDADRLTVLRRWPIAGKITAGPFLRAGRIGCIVA
ncbi:MAG TPA: PQQ-binding-like beta-propeller repeat protein, partial [Gemmataceae bacterium]|nr:PQQ-binding-like beta-propeller repeat protein [Gemmataceae bacterium]